MSTTPLEACRPAVLLPTQPICSREKVFKHKITSFLSLPLAKQSPLKGAAYEKKGLPLKCWNLSPATLGSPQLLAV